MRSSKNRRLGLSSALGRVRLNQLAVTTAKKIRGNDEDDVPRARAVRAVRRSLQVSGKSAAAQSYPNRTVTIVVTSAAGGLTDVLTRAVGQRLSQMWNQGVVIENKGGAGHTFAAAAVKSAPLDGYTLLATETGMFTMQPFLHAKGKLNYDPVNDFVPVAGYASIPMALLAIPPCPPSPSPR